MGRPGATVALLQNSIRVSQECGSRGRVRRTGWVRFFEYLRGESLDPGSLLPRVRGQSRLAAGFFQELFAIPIPLHSHLRQQEAALRSARNYQPVPPNLDVLRGNVREGREDGNFQVQSFHFTFHNGRKAWVLQCRPHRTLADRDIKRLLGLNDADAPAQILSFTQGYKGAARLAQCLPGFRDFGDLRKVQIPHQGFPRHAQQGLLIAFTERQHPSLPVLSRQPPRRAGGGRRGALLDHPDISRNSRSIARRKPPQTARPSITELPREDVKP